VETLRQEALNEYRRRLKAHDWSYDYSDDYHVYKRGKEELGWLRGQQKMLDPDYTIWNSFAPYDYQRP
jgi:hypothetical protein